MSVDTFGRWLLHQIERREWKAADFARRLDVRPGVVSHWIRGERLPSTDSCQRIADVLNVDPDWVLTLAGHRPNVEELAPDDPRTDLIAMVRRVRWDAEREAIVRGVLDAMLKAGKPTGGGG